MENMIANKYVKSGKFFRYFYLISIIFIFMMISVGCKSKSKTLSDKETLDNKTDIDYVVTDKDLIGTNKRYTVRFDEPVEGTFSKTLSGFEKGYYYMIMECAYEGGGDYAFAWALTDSENKTSIPVSSREKDVTVRGMK